MEKSKSEKGRKSKRPEKLKAQKPRKPKKVTMLDTELEPLKEADSLLHRIEMAEADCDRKSVEVDSIRDQLKAARGAYMHAVSMLRKLCRARKEKHPLFDQPKYLKSEISKPTIEWNRPRDAVTIELTEDMTRIDPQLVMGSEHHPWGIGSACVTLLQAGVEVFVDDGMYRITTGSDLVDSARKECKAGMNAEQWEEWLRARPECRRSVRPPLPAMPVVTIASGTEQHGIAKGTIAPIYLVKPGGLLVMGSETPTAITDEEYTADDVVAALIAEARQRKITSDADAWREFVTGKPTLTPAKAGTTSTNPQLNENWKGLPLDAAGINGRGGKLLAEAGYETLGAVAKLMQDHGQWWNKEIKGIGEETAAEIADRFAEFWAAHPEYCQAAMQA